MAKSERKGKTFIWIILLIVFIAGAAIGFYAYTAVLGAAIKTDEEYFYVNSSDNYHDIINNIKSKGVVKQPKAFEYLADYMDLKENINPGRYKLDKSMSNRQFIGNLRGGYQEAVKFRFENLRKIDSLGILLGRNFEADSTKFLELLKSEDVAEKYGFTKENFFSMFVPNTYEIYWNTSPNVIIDRFHDEYNKFWNDGRKAKADSLGMTPIEVSTLASIVKGEALHKDEMPKIAGLYINRLRKGILLQADPTVIFANNDFTIRRVLNRHLTIDNPYNTYKYKGLPPGPIMLPSIAAIDAVLNFEKHDYIYMCAKDDFSGYHLFAKTQAEHLVNARKFQKALTERNIMR